MAIGSKMYCYDHEIEIFVDSEYYFISCKGYIPRPVYVNIKLK